MTRWGGGGADVGMILYTEEQLQFCMYIVSGFFRQFLDIIGKMAFYPWDLTLNNQPHVYTIVGNYWISWVE